MGGKFRVTSPNYMGGWVSNNHGKSSISARRKYCARFDIDPEFMDSLTAKLLPRKKGNKKRKK